VGHRRKTFPDRRQAIQREEKAPSKRLDRAGGKSRAPRFDTETTPPTRAAVPANVHKTCGEPCRGQSGRIQPSAWRGP
jgi:hypothetical protein